MTLLGCDVSKWQGVVDYKAVAAAGVKFCFAKAVHGTTLDPRFVLNWTNMNGVLYRGAYGWYIPEQDATEQADALVDAMRDFSMNDLPPAVDFEQPTKVPAATLLANITTYVKRLRERTGRKPLLYTGKWYWAEYVKDSDCPELIQLCDLWHAEYPNTGRTGVDYEGALSALGSPHPPSPWAKRGIAPRLWQFDGDKGLTLPGGQDADFNRFDGSDEEFAAWNAASILVEGSATVIVAPPFNSIREVQIELLALGYDLGISGADNLIGPKTTTAIKAFQTAAGLTSTGIVGPDTRAALQAAWLRQNGG
jgi:GH25 family lysozyme M1 (1,4-beta-N-acetylmuramidase)